MEQSDASAPQRLF